MNKEEMKWPSDEGYWWCDHFADGVTVEIVEAFTGPDGKMYIESAHFERILPADNSIHVRYTTFPRFIKCEPNPFSAHQERE